MHYNRYMFYLALALIAVVIFTLIVALKRVPNKELSTSNATTSVTDNTPSLKDALLVPVALLGLLVNASIPVVFIILSTSN